MDPLIDFANSTILIVDDDPTVVLTLSKKLSSLGKIQFANSGEKALTMVADSQPDIILLDVELPRMSGVEVCARLKKSDETASIPIIFMTSHNEVNFEERMFEIGAADYFQKPIKFNIALARTKTHLFNKLAFDRLTKLSQLDGLTGLHNRRELDNQLDSEWARAQRSKDTLAVLMIDVDEFKKYNDFYGHSAGDECLKNIASLLKKSVSRSSDFVARYGGEEFTIVLPNTTHEGARHLAQSIIDSFGIKGIEHAPDAMGNNVTISVGIAVEAFPSGGSVKQLVETADNMLFEAKQNGRNRLAIAPKTEALLVSHIRSSEQ